MDTIIKEVHSTINDSLTSVEQLDRLLDKLETYKVGLSQLSSMVNDSRENKVVDNVGKMVEDSYKS